MFELTIKGDIAAAHFLRNYEGECKNLHGHTWKVAVMVQGQYLDDAGMVSDFKVLKKQLREFLTPLDHVCLNDLDYFKEVNPTTENIARYIYRNFALAVDPLKVKQVEVWESDSASVRYYE